MPGQCASACLDALDVFTRFGNTVLVGAPSAADSTYMEARTVPLPSGLGVTVIPNKIWVQRPRGNGEGYFPDIENLAMAWTLESFIQLIEADLARPRR